MKQGRASKDVVAGKHVNPANKPINPARVAQMGSMLGNKAMDQPEVLPGAGVPLYRAENGRAPIPTVKIHVGGSQGRR